MASLIDTLIDVLDKENTEYKELLDLSNKKTTVIVSGDVEELQVILAQEQKLIDRINVLDNKREENVRDICNVLNLKMDRFKVTDLINMLSKQPKEQERLTVTHSALKKTINQLVKINDNNKVILQESLDMIEFEINLARNSVMAPETANYGRGAYSEMGPVAGTFDAKQ